jgi:isopropylmalate/homocitrate/citramalate synthase
MMIAEVGPRDGLQNEARAVPTAAKLAFIEGLRAAGLTAIEATAFVSPERVPQMADADAVWSGLPADDETLFWALVPNLRGLERANAAGCDRIAVFTSAGEEFARRNIGMSVAESLEIYRALIEASPETDFHRAYVSVAFECPYEGRIPAAQTVQVARALVDLGFRQVVISDTIGAATAGEVLALARALTAEGLLSERLAWHFHDTWGSALANVSAVLDYEIPAAIDSSAAGLGGCPFAPGAAGNLATEDLTYFLEREGFATGVDLDQLIQASEQLLKVLERSSSSKAWAAAQARRSR